MTHRYRITLHSPMGPREGELTLTGEVNGAVTGILSVLGFQQPVSGRESSGHIQLQHRLRTAMQELDSAGTDRRDHHRRDPHGQGLHPLDRREAAGLTALARDPPIPRQRSVFHE